MIENIGVLGYAETYMLKLRVVCSLRKDFVISAYPVKYAETVLSKQASMIHPFSGKPFIFRDNPNDISTYTLDRTRSRTFELALL